jgi:hypothetical protein
MHILLYHCLLHITLPLYTDMHMYARTDIGGRRIWRAHPIAELCGHGAVGAVGFSKPAFHALPPPTLIPLGVCVCVCVCVCVRACVCVCQLLFYLVCLSVCAQWKALVPCESNPESLCSLKRSQQSRVTAATLPT